jgi:hypothetical protein
MVVWEGKGNIFLVYLVPKFGDPKTLIAGTYNKTKMTRVGHEQCGHFHRIGMAAKDLNNIMEHGWER